MKNAEDVRVEIARPSLHDPADPASGILDASRPLGVYVHFPFCRARCPYCDFATAVREPIPHDDYAAVVVAELAERAGWFRGKAPRTCRRSTLAAARPAYGGPRPSGA